MTDPGPDIDVNIGGSRFLLLLDIINNLVGIPVDNCFLNFFSGGVDPFSNHFKHCHLLKIKQHGLWQI